MKLYHLSRRLFNFSSDGLPSLSLLLPSTSSTISLPIWPPLSSSSLTPLFSPSSSSLRHQPPEQSLSPPPSNVFSRSPSIAPKTSLSPVPPVIQSSFFSSASIKMAALADPTAVVPEQKVHEVVIIGSGPAGWTAALYTARAELEPICFEGELSEEILPGGQLMTTTEVENFPGYPDGITGPDMMDQFKAQAEKFGTKTLSETITRIDTSVRPFILYAGEKIFRAKAIILATGASAKYLGIESEKKFMNRGVSGCATCDGALPRFRNKPIVVVGGGDTAMEEATFLSKFGSQVIVVHRRDAFRASKIMAARVLANPKIKVEWNSVVDEIVGDDVKGVTGVRLKNLQTGETKDVAASGYFVAIGHKPNSDLVASVVETDEQGYIIPAVPGSTHTKVDGLFACGDVVDKVYRQAITAAGSGCAAALDATRWLEALEAQEAEEKVAAVNGVVA